MTPLLTIDAVCKRFGGYTALDAIQLEIQQGEFIALLGPSGCGKTTLLRSIAGLMTPDSGRIVIDGQDVSNLPPYRRPLNTVFQNYALFPHMTVLENVAYGPRRQGVARAEANTRALASLELVGLAALGARYPREMSGGQQQRVALARAIVNRPKLLLLDEPLSALDMKLRKRMQLELKHLQIKLGIAFVFVTHDQEEAMTMADRIVVMNAGRIEQMGAGTDIYRAPASRFVAEFIGEANLIGYEAAGNNQIRLAVQGNTFAVPTAQIPPRGVAVLRPEHVQVLDAATPARDALCRLTGVLKDIVSVGSHTTIHADVGGHLITARTMGLPNADMTPGSAVQLGFQPSHLHLIGDGT
ncbi:ABC transporter ATP-binding protein [Glaciimonas sp. PCH181]|uniref:ABC transporter ATP-binding protein n=1 Tax=Glaciimonas sp. PCH181 TaxID=2133943 RepID=UPI000D39DDAC|nr:ABC transporter ATP-binding protein [Glaciimonas sp. PCH181]PUA18372.1 Fe3+/spermidine/putrescine ABC transporter ATP-binding protein [Glaciimonas sp. PCH181]